MRQGSRFHAPFGALLAFLALAGCSETATDPGQQPAVEDARVDTQIAQAKTAIGTFAETLKSELTSAMREGGPLNAIEVCNTRAMDIRETVSAEHGLELSRVSLKNRNPQNAPVDWQRAVLESFDERRRAGADPSMLDWHEVAEVNGESEFRYMKAIPTGGLCLQCHGQNLAPEVSEALQTLYPEDKAVGFSAGDIRGAFVVKRRLP